MVQIFKPLVQEDLDLTPSLGVCAFTELREALLDLGVWGF